MGIQDPLYPMLSIRECIGGVGQAGCLMEVTVRGSLESCQYEVCPCWVQEYIGQIVSVSAIAPILRKHRSPLLVHWGTTFGEGHISSIELIPS